MPIDEIEYHRRDFFAAWFAYPIFDVLVEECVNSQANPDDSGTLAVSLRKAIAEKGPDDLHDLWISELYGKMLNLLPAEEANKENAHALRMD